MIIADRNRLDVDLFPGLRRRKHRDATNGLHVLVQLKRSDKCHQCESDEEGCLQRLEYKSINAFSAILTSIFRPSNHCQPALRRGVASRIRCAPDREEMECQGEGCRRGERLAISVVPDSEEDIVTVWTQSGYKLAHNDEAKLEIAQRFDELCRTKTNLQSLNQALKRLRNNKAELLLVLKRPDIPLHNNLSESDIREYVIKRKISGSTRSDNGRRARDTFASLKKTCQKLGIGFWDYLLDRLTLDNRIPPLPEIVAGTASLPP